MKSRTSFFNATVLKKDLARFAPVWVLYAIFQVLFVFLMWGDEGEPARFVVNATDILTGMGMLNLLYGGLCAFLLFGDLFRSRMCNMLHALPMRREGWFLTHLTSGMLFCLLPNTIGALLAALLLQQYAYAAFLWLAVMTLQYLFFFGVAVFSVMCAGNVLGSIAVYSIFNFFAILAAWLAVTFYEPMLYGVTLYMEDYVNFSPAVAFSTAKYFGFDYDNMHSVATFTGFVTEDWFYLFIAGSLGLVLLGLSLLLYRRRNLEAAGDLISFRPVAPVFLVIYTLCLGALLFICAEAFSNGLAYIFLLVGFAIGFFTGRMLLEKRLGVFNKRNFAGFGILVGAFVLSIVLAMVDPFGITRYVPKTEQVASVSISPYIAKHYIENRSCVLSDPEDIAVITQIHSQKAKNRPFGGDSNLVISYRMKNGHTVQRAYPITITDPDTQQLNAFYSRPETVMGSRDIDALMRSFNRIKIYPQYADPDMPHILIANTESRFTDELENIDKYVEENDIVIKEAFSGSETVRGLLEAILADCEAGNMAQYWDYHTGETYCTINLEQYTGNYQTRYWDITVYSECKNTIAFLKTLNQ